MTRLLVTGADGFVGRNLMADLLAAGWDAVGVDHADGDLTEFGVAERLVREHRPDVVVHLAAQVGRLFGEDDVARSITSNALATGLLAKATADAGARMAYVSTSEVYGDQGDADCAEDGPLTLPHNIYGLSKYWGEQAAQLYCPDGLQILRLSMPYGPGVVPGRGRAALLNILWQANTGQTIPVHRGAERSWCWVGDTTRGIRIVLEDGERATTAPESAAGVGVYNIGRDDAAVQILDVARIACRMTDAPDTLIDLIDAPGAQTVVKRLSTAKLRALGWSPEVELEQGMELVFEWIRQFDEHGRPTEATPAAPTTTAA
ncbi:MAG: NAD-dependent epimerase/dehydratase [Thermoleophilia bacterium]|nr:NAD-dependent epimerase/dehydratase [Thermoleophilia bacterium]